MRSLLFGAVLLLLVATPSFGQGGPPPASVYVDTARVMRVSTFREATGSLRPERRSLVASREEGRVVLFDLREGDRVEAGDVLAKLDDVLLVHEVERARADVARDRGVIEEREAELANAERDLRRLESLAEKGSARPVELDDAETGVTRARAQLRQAEAELAADGAALATAARRLRDMTIVAPFDGRVVATSTEVGEWVDSGETVAELVALDVIECWLDVPETGVDELRASSEPVKIRVRALEREYEAPVAAVIPDADPLSRLFPVMLLIDNSDGALAPGMSVTGLTPTGVEGDVLTVHQDAVRVDDLGEYVFYDQAGTAAVARVRTLYRVGDRAVIRPGSVREGTRVVVEGNERMFPGQPLNVMGEGSPASGGVKPVSEGGPGSGRTSGGGA